MIRVGGFTGGSALFFLAAVLSFSSVHAQSVDSSKAERPNSLKPGAWALQFQITQDFTLQAFQGLLVSGKVHFSRNQALRFGAGVSAAMSDFENVSRELLGDTLRERRDGESESNGQSFNLAAQYLIYPSPGGRLGLFLGAGPQVRFNHNLFRSERMETFFDTAEVTIQIVSKNESNLWGVGISGVLGAEWFAIKTVSFHAEYSLFFEYASQDFASRSTRVFPTGPVTSEFEQDEKSFKFGQGSVRFGLSVYF